jgi:hypothetical protein
LLSKKKKKKKKKRGVGAKIEVEEGLKIAKSVKVGCILWVI